MTTRILKLSNSGYLMHLTCARFGRRDLAMAQRYF